MDFYKILNVSESADANTIKKAYRKLSLKTHPDKNKGNDVEFKKVNEAYQILGDPSKKQAYDLQRQNPFMNAGGIPGMSDIFNTIFRAQSMGGRPMGMAGGGFPFGGMPNVRVYHNGVPVNFNSQMRKPIPIVKTIGISLQQAYMGLQYPLEIERWIEAGGNKVLEKEKVYVNIPAGIDDSEMIIMRGKGNIISETNKGDIKLFVKIENTSKFKRKGMDLVYKKKLTLKEALIGFSFEIKFLHGKLYSINNINGKIIQSGFKKIIPGMGMKRSGTYGNLIIVFDVIFPDKLTDLANKSVRKNIIINKSWINSRK